MHLYSLLVRTIFEMRYTYANSTNPSRLPNTPTGRFDLRPAGQPFMCDVLPLSLNRG